MRRIDQHPLRGLGLTLPLVVLAAVAFAPGCTEEGAGADARAPDAGDARIGQDVGVVLDARVDALAADAAQPDAELDARVDAAPNPNVIVLPPSGQTEIIGFTNGGFIATYADSRGTPQKAADVYYYDVLARQEVQVTDRYSDQSGADTNGSEILFHDYQYYSLPNANYQVELYSYSIADATETRLTYEVSKKLDPVFNDSYILFSSNVGCGAQDIYNLTLLDRTTGEATVVADCDSGAAPYSISDEYAAWVARPYPGHNKDVFVRDLAAGFTFRLESTDVGSQVFPTTDSDHVVWQDTRDGRREIYMYTFSTGVEECLTPDSWEQAWPSLRDGIVAWSDYRYSQQWGENAPCDVYVYEIASGVGRRVTTESRTWMPRYVDSGWLMYGRWIIGRQFKLYMHDLVNDGILSPDGHVIP